MPLAKIDNFFKKIDRLKEKTKEINIKIQNRQVQDRQLVEKSQFLPPATFPSKKYISFNSVLRSSSSRLSRPLVKMGDKCSDINCFSTVLIKWTSDEGSK